MKNHKVIMILFFSIFIILFSRLVFSDGYVCCRNCPSECTGSGCVCMSHGGSGSVSCGTNRETGEPCGTSYVTCTPCGSNEVCEDAECVCNPNCDSRDDCCSGKECGTVSDGCGRNYNCGSCKSDGWYCIGEIKEYRDYKCSSGKCKYDSSNEYNCNNNNGWYCSDDTREYRDYKCSSGSCVVDQRSDSYNCNQDDDWYCRERGTIYRYEDYYCGGGDKSAECWFSVTDSTRDGDYSSGACLCLLTGYWNISGEVSVTLPTEYWSIGGEVSATTCCGDDSSEYRITCRTNDANQGATC